jgi:hypothetical protein
MAIKILCSRLILMGNSSVDLMLKVYTDEEGGGGEVEREGKEGGEEEEKAVCRAQ